MPILLFWYILRDLLKVLLISTAVLVTIISFGAAIRPLSDGTLGPVSLIRYIILAIPPMLQFALPFSAAFSATMVYHRMTSDNEIAACAASGVSYTQLLLPPATLGVVLTILLSLISNYISPRFWEAMARTSTRDVAEVVISSIGRGEPIRTEGTLLYARAARRVPVPENNPADDAIWLDRLLAVSLEKGQVVSTYTARECIFYLQRAEQYTVISSVVDDSRFYDLTPGSKSSAVVRVGEATPPEFVVQDNIDRTPRFMDVNRLNEVYQHPELYDRVARRIAELRRWMTYRELFATINDRLEKTGEVRFELQRLDHAGQPVTADAFLRGGGLVERDPHRWEVVAGAQTGEVTFITYRGGQPEFSIRSLNVVLRPRVHPTNAEPTLDIELNDLEQTDLTSPARHTTRFARQSFLNMRIQSPIVRELLDKSPRELVAQAHTLGDDATLYRLEQQIAQETLRLKRNIIARIHERTAMSVSCLVMMLLGSILAIFMRSTLPLTVYLWSFVPAILGLVLISAGADVVKDIGSPEQGKLIGLIVMWLGNGIMAFLWLVILRRVMRN